MSVRLSYDERKLILEVSQSNEIAFKELFNIYRSKLYSYIFNVSQSKEFSEDAVHDIFLKVWMNRQKLPTILNLNAYLYRMARNHAYNGLRRRATEVLVMAEIAPPAGVKDPEEKLIKKEVKQLIQKIINHLTPQQKEVFGMSWEEGLKQEEIAQRLNISILTVKRHLTDARNFLRKEISSFYPLESFILFIIFFFL